MFGPRCSRVHSVGPRRRPGTHPGGDRQRDGDKREVSVDPTKSSLSDPARLA